MIEKLIKKYQDKLIMWTNPNSSYIHSNEFNYEIYTRRKRDLEEILQDLEELKNKCPHSKKYDDLIRCSNPPKRQWICQICGEVGYDTIGVDKDE